MCHNLNLKMALNEEVEEGARLGPNARDAEILVFDYMRAQMELKGFAWSPTCAHNRANGSSAPNGCPSGDVRDGGGGVGDSEGGQSLDRNTRDKLKEALVSVAEEQMASYGSHILELVGQLSTNSGQPSIDYINFKGVANELFSGGVKWCHIVTLLVFGSELAYSSGVSTGYPEFVNKVAQWLVLFLSTPDIINWVRSHGGWEGLIDFVDNGRAAAANRQAANGAEGRWGNGFVVGLGGALGFLGVTALATMLTRH